MKSEEQCKICNQRSKGEPWLMWVKLALLVIDIPVSFVMAWLLIPTVAVLMNMLTSASLLTPFGAFIVLASIVMATATFLFGAWVNARSFWCRYKTWRESHE